MKMAVQIGEEKKHKCKYGCGYEHGHKGAMNIHENIHCSKKERRGDPVAKDNPKCDCKDGGSWRLLNKNDDREAAAIEMGYKKVCNECDELDK
jgi:hypothetical protein